MPPQIPPVGLYVVFSASNKRPMVEHAKNIGISPRQFCRLLRRPWSDWRVEYAWKWCESMGYNFWHLEFTPKMAVSVDWSSRSELTEMTIKMLFHLRHGTFPTPAKVSAARKVLVNWYAPPCGDHG